METSTAKKLGIITDDEYKELEVNLEELIAKEKERGMLAQLEQIAKQYPEKARQIIAGIE
jgi:hypothetical protein